MIKIQAIKSESVIKLGDDLFSILRRLPKIKTGDIFVISSKVVSLCEGRAIPKDKVKSRDALIVSESEQYIPRRPMPRGQALITVKNHTLTLSAGVDEFGENFLLWPKRPAKTAEKIWRFFRRRDKIKKFGVIIADSHSVPLRRGALGFALGFHGFKPLRIYRGSRDLFGRVMKMTIANLADGLAAAAVAEMGEGGEQTPFALISGAKAVDFGQSVFGRAKDESRFYPASDEDFFAPFLKSKIWKKKRQ